MNKRTATKKAKSARRNSPATVAAEEKLIRRINKQYRQSKTVAFSLPEACVTEGPRAFTIVWREFQCTKRGELSVDQIFEELNGLIERQIDENCYEIGRVRRVLDKEVIHTVACLQGAMALIGKYEESTKEYRDGELVSPASPPRKAKSRKVKSRN